MNLIIDHIRTTLKSRGATTFTDAEELRMFDADEFQPSTIPNLHVMQLTNQLRGLHTIIRNVHTSRSDFIFYSNRLTRLLVEEAMESCQQGNVQSQLPQEHNMLGRWLMARWLELVL